MPSASLPLPSRRDHRPRARASSVHSITRGGSYRAAPLQPIARTHPLPPGYIHRWQYSAASGLDPFRDPVRVRGSLRSSGPPRPCAPGGAGFELARPVFLPHRPGPEPLVATQLSWVPVGCHAHLGPCAPPAARRTSAAVCAHARAPGGEWRSGHAQGPACYTGGRTLRRTRRPASLSASLTASGADQRAIMSGVLGPFLLHCIRSSGGRSDNFSAPPPGPGFAASFVWSGPFRLPAVRSGALTYAEGESPVRWGTASAHSQTAEKYSRATKVSPLVVCISE